MKNIILPENCEQRKIGSRARAILHYQINTDCWEYREESGNDYGRDCVIELSVDNSWINCKLEGQIKGTHKPNLLQNKKEFSIAIPIKTINYALCSSISFVLFYIDTIKEDVYYVSIQDYFISNQNLFDKLSTNKSSINIRIPMVNMLSKNDYELKQLAMSTYLDGPSKKLCKRTKNINIC